VGYAPCGKPPVKTFLQAVQYNPLRLFKLICAHEGYVWPFNEINVQIPNTVILFDYLDGMICLILKTIMNGGYAQVRSLPIKQTHKQYETILLYNYNDEYACYFKLS